jgi:hypothetical protein
MDCLIVFLDCAGLFLRDGITVLFDALTLSDDLILLDMRIDGDLRQCDEHPHAVFFIKPIVPVYNVRFGPLFRAPVQILLDAVQQILKKLALRDLLFERLAIQLYPILNRVDLIGLLALHEC